MGINIRSLLPKFHQLLLEINDCELDLISVSETWLKKDIDSSLISIDGFSLVRLDRSITLPNGEAKKGGGVCLYINNKYTYSIVDNATYCTPDLEVLSINVRIPNCRSVTVITSYRPPSGNATIAVSLIRELLNQVTCPEKRQDILLMGDLNIDMLVNCNNRRQLLDACDEFGLCSHIDLPTRTTLHGSSFLDVIITLMTHIHQTGVISSSISDHYPVFLVKKKEKIIRLRTSFQGRSYRDLDPELFCNTIKFYNWGRFYATENIDEAWSELYNVILQTANDLCPIKTFNIKGIKPAWYSTDLIELIANRDELFRECKRLKDETLHLEAKRLRNLAKTGIINARSEYYLRLAEKNKKCPKKFWETIREISPKSSSNGITTVIDPKTSALCDITESPDIINDFFSTIGTKLAGNIPPATDPGTSTPQVRE